MKEEIENKVPKILHEILDKATEYKNGETSPDEFEAFLVGGRTTWELYNGLSPCYCC